MKRIESRNNPTIKSMNSLSARKTREDECLFYFEGVHLLEEYLRAGKMPKAIFVREDVVSRYGELINSVDCDVYEVTQSVYDKITDEKAPQGIFTLSEYLSNVCAFGKEEAENLKGNTIMLCDLQDMGNVGTVIRTAASLNCNVLLCGNCADVYSSKTVRATMGALFTGDVFISPSAEEAVGLIRSSGKRVIAAALTDKAETLGEFEIKCDDCFIVGNEGKGLPDAVISKCDITAIIPMSGRTESLNAAAASAILMWEAMRGRIK